MSGDIAGLDDARALEILKTIAKTHLEAGEFETEAPEAIAEAAASALGLSAGDADVSEGDMARAALQVLADDPKHGPPLRALVDGPRPESLFLGAEMAGVVAAIIALQMYGKIERDSDGNTTWEFGKKAASNELLKLFVEKLLSFLSKFGG